MTHPLHASFITHLCRTCVFTAILAAPAVVMAAPWGGPTMAACASQVPGSYLLSIDFSNGDFSSRGVLSLSQDGILIVNDSSQGGLPGKWDPFTSGQGAWRCAGPRAFSALSINFNVPGTLDPDGGMARLDYKGQLDAAGRISGTVELRFFEIYQDPLHDSVPLSDTFFFTGQRIGVKYPK